VTEERILLVLDDFEANLATGGGAFLDDDVATYLHFLAERTRSGRILITSRNSVPGTEQYLRRIPIGPLSPAQTRKLLMRLPRLAGRDVGTIATALRVIGGHRGARISGCLCCAAARGAFQP
jgi:hypothetical protein